MESNTEIPFDSKIKPNKTPNKIMKNKKFTLVRLIIVLYTITPWVVLTAAAIYVVAHFVCKFW